MPRSSNGLGGSRSGCRSYRHGPPRLGAAQDSPKESIFAGMTQRSTSNSNIRHADPPSANLPDLIQEREPELLLKAASDLRMTEDLALTLLERSDLPPLVLEKLSK